MDGFWLAFGIGFVSATFLILALLLALVGIYDPDARELASQAEAYRRRRGQVRRHNQTQGGPRPW
jgi:hypothetical protein